MSKNGLYRVLHTADWHLGKTLCDQSREDEHRAFLAWLAQTIVELDVDLLLVAGDIFDSANPPHSATAMYYDFLYNLHCHDQCDVVVIGGNHDSARQLDSVAPLLRTHCVHVFGAMPAQTEDCVLLLPDRKAPKIAVAAVPFLRDRDVRVGQIGQTANEIQAQLIDGIARRYNEAFTKAAEQAPNLPIIATGHLTIAGSTSSDSEREIHIGGLGAVTSDHFSPEFAYIALGHLHRPQTTNAQGTMRYSGSPIALSFSEANDSKEVRLLDFDTNKLVRQESLSVPVYRKLLRLACPAEKAIEFVSNYSWPEIEGGCFVELTLVGASAVSISADAIRACVTNPNVRILQIVMENTALDVSLRAGEVAIEDAIRDLRDQPKAVFKRRLDDLSELTASDKEALQVEFDCLLDEMFTAEAGASPEQMPSQESAT